MPDSVTPVGKRDYPSPVSPEDPVEDELFEPIGSRRFIDIACAFSYSFCLGSVRLACASLKFAVWYRINTHHAQTPSESLCMLKPWYRMLLSM
jgi:hypothetical protein